jgi:hypothetical protein
VDKLEQIKHYGVLTLWNLHLYIILGLSSTIWAQFDLSQLTWYNLKQVFQRSATMSSGQIELK